MQILVATYNVRMASEKVHIEVVSLASIQKPIPTQFHIPPLPQAQTMRVTKLKLNSQHILMSIRTDVLQILHYNADLNDSFA
jgi:hypothetical protein